MEITLVLGTIVKIKWDTFDLVVFIIRMGSFHAVVTKRSVIQKWVVELSGEKLRLSDKATYRWDTCDLVVFKLHFGVIQCTCYKIGTMGRLYTVKSIDTLLMIFQYSKDHQRPSNS